MKQCGRCGRELPLDEFAWKSREAGTKQSYCRSCQAEYRREHYEDNRNRYVAKARRWKDQARRERGQWLIGFFAENPCVDCGEDDPIVLQFDHVRGEKEFSISQELTNKSMEDIEAEIAKCEVRCANCHMRVTAQRAEWSLYAGVG